MPPVRAERLDRQIQSRRDTLAKLASLSLAVPALWNAAGDRLVAEAVDMPVTAPVVAVDTSAKLKSYIARDFFFQYNPQEFKLLQDPNDINPKPGQFRFFFSFVSFTAILLLQQISLLP